MSASYSLDGKGIDFITVLPVDDCLDCLTQGAVHILGQRVITYREEGRVRVESGGRGSGVWLLRFEGELISSSVGTRVLGQMRRNHWIEASLIVPGVITSGFTVLGVIVGQGFVALLSLFLLLMFAAYYVYYWRTLTRQASDLLRWVIDCCT